MFEWLRGFIRRPSLGFLVTVLITTAAAPFASAEETKQVVAGAQYERSGFYKFWFGKDYRKAWTTPIEVSVLDLDAEAGGLTVVRQVGGKQTPSLALLGADGRSYTFRSVNKDASRILPEEWHEAAAASIIQDQTAASYPGVFPFVNGLVEALGLNVLRPQRLVVMPDDPRLGEYREAFAGMLGTFGEYPQPAHDDVSGFRGASEILSTKELWGRWLEGPENKPDAFVFLRYRTVDLWTGNWDRHSKQWRWARVPDREYFQPVAEDPDQIFSNYGGVLLKYARWSFPKFLRFKDKISGIEGAVFNGADVDRWILTELDRDTFLSVARMLTACVRGEEIDPAFAALPPVCLSDEVIDQAMSNLPPEWYAIDGEMLAARLKARRDNLMAGMERYYNHLATQVDIHATNRDELVRIERSDDGSVQVTVALDAAGAEPYYQRRFVPKETKDVRIYLYGGKNRVISNGPPKGKIRVRVIGGPDDDSLDDSQSGKTRFYDFEGDNTVVKGRGTKVDDRPWVNPAPNEDNPWQPARDYRTYNHPEALLWWDGDLGFLLGAGFNRTNWGFRKYPYAASHQGMLAFSTARTSFAFDYNGSYRRMNSNLSTGARLRVSGFDALNYFGFGNETVKNDELDSEDFYRVRENVIRVLPTLNWEPNDKFDLFFGPEFQTTDETSTDTLISIEQPYGSGKFDQVGLVLGFEWDSQAKNKTEGGSRLSLLPPPGEGRITSLSRTGFKIFGEASYFPAVLDVVEDFGAFEGAAIGYLGLGKKDRFVFAGRAGGRRVRGNFPWHEAAFIGGPDSNRGFARQRFAGEDSLYGNLELRIQVLKGVFIFPGRVWVFGLVDAGRVWVDDEDSTEWHPSYGGGLVVELAATPIKFWTGVAKNDDEGDLRFYFNSGFSF